jgi:hypothetical protein
MLPPGGRGGDLDADADADRCVVGATQEQLGRDEAAGFEPAADGFEGGVAGHWGLAAAGCGRDDQDGDAAGGVAGTLGGEQRVEGGEHIDTGELNRGGAPDEGLEVGGGDQAIAVLQPAGDLALAVGELLGRRTAPCGDRVVDLDAGVGDLADLAGTEVAVGAGVDLVGGGDRGVDWRAGAGQAGAKAQLAGFPVDLDHAGVVAALARGGLDVVDDGPGAAIDAHTQRAGDDRALGGAQALVGGCRHRGRAARRGCGRPGWRGRR